MPAMVWRSPVWDLVMLRTPVPRVPPPEPGALHAGSLLNLGIALGVHIIAPISNEDTKAHRETWSHRTRLGVQPLTP